MRPTPRLIDVTFALVSHTSDSVLIYTRMLNGFDDDVLSIYKSRSEVGHNHLYFANDDSRNSDSVYFQITTLSFERMHKFQMIIPFIVKPTSTSRGYTDIRYIMCNRAGYLNA